MIERSINTQNGRLAELLEMLKRLCEPEDGLGTS
jgi:hypothetical protein